MRGDEFFQEIASRPPLTKLHSRIASFLKTCLAGEKVIPFGGKQVINTQFPPYPSRAFERLLDHFLKDDAKRLYSVLQERKGKRKTFQVRHDYVACIAQRC